MQQLWLSTIFKAGGVSEAGVLGLQEGRLTLHLFPQRQNFFRIILQTLQVHIFQPQFLKQNKTAQCHMYELYTYHKA